MNRRLEYKRYLSHRIRGLKPLVVALIAAVICLLTLLVFPKPKETSPEKNTVAMRNPNLNWSEQHVQQGDNLSAIFQRSGLTALDVHRVLSSNDGEGLVKLSAGESFHFGLNSNRQLIELRYVKSPLEHYLFSAQGNEYVSKKWVRQSEIVIVYRKGVIEESLYLAGVEANVPNKTIMELANIFGWDIDFVFDIRRGDSFALLFEERYIDGEKLSPGDVIAASFTNRGKQYYAVRYTNGHGLTNYYSPDGVSLSKAFLRTPVELFRISSEFNLRRKHPIHNKITAHRGVDYAAPVGTPVRATGDGKVIEAGYTRVNGNYVYIQHGQTYVTKYLHLNRKKVNRGEMVRQGQYIGTVGATGYATGPHLHYEFLVNGVHRNPRTVKLPQAQPISKSEKAAFHQRATVILERLKGNQRTNP
jgi:murein DD-endopeptidase MepM/ murein hydrolase activator NlpD